MAPGASLKAGLSVAELEDEIVVLDVMISSLDPDADDYSEQSQELEANRTRLESALAALESGHPSWPRSRAQQEDQGEHLGTHSSDRQLDSNSDSEQEADFNTGASSSARTPAGSMKRSRAHSSFDSDHPLLKRHSPGIFGTPLAPRDNTDRARRQQLLREAELQREYADRMYAQQLHREVASSSQSSYSQLPPGADVQTTLSHNGSFQRPPPIVPSQTTSVVPQVVYPTAPSPQNFPPITPRTVVKPEFSSAHAQHSTPRPFLNASAPVVDLTNSDGEESDNNDLISGDAQDIRRRRLPLDPPVSSSPVPVRSSPGGLPSFPPNSTMPISFPAYAQAVYHSSPGPSQTPHPQSSRYGPISYDPRSRMNPAMLHAAHFNRVYQSLKSSNQSRSGSSRALPWNVDGDNDDDDDDENDSMPNFARGYEGNEELYRHRYDALAHYDPLKSKEEIQALLQNIRPDEDMPAHLRVKTPDAMTVTLHKYQELGLTWLQNCEQGSNKGGILADDMGLGKTVQMISLMVTRKSEEPRCKTTLIIAPVALMRQWKQEIEQKIKRGKSFSVFTHHGASKAKEFKDLRYYDVVLTTYGSLAAEVKRREMFAVRLKADPSARPKPNERCVLLGEECMWYRVVLDEAQCIKNKSTQTAKGACMLNAKYRFCVTGTPMMNNVEELYSLVHFLRIRPYSAWEKFRMDFVRPLKSANEHTQQQSMQMLQALCKAIMLRRTKKSTFEGKPILILPERTTEMDHPTFSEDEEQFYRSLESKTQIRFNKYLRRGEVGSNYSEILLLLLRLRQACCHPHLIKDFGVSANGDVNPEQMMDFARELSDSVVARIKETKGHFECPVCYDVTPNPAIFIPCGHDTCAECFARIADPANALADGDERGHARCPNCRGNVDPKRLTDFLSFKKVYMPELLTEEEINPPGQENSSDSNDSDDSSDSSEDESDDDGDNTLGGFIVRDDASDADEDDTDDETDDDLDKPLKNEIRGADDPTASSSKTTKVKKQDDDKEYKPDIKHSENTLVKKKSKNKRKGKQREKSEKPKNTLTLAELKKLASRNAKAKKKYLRRLRKDWVSSAKIDKTMELLHEIMAAPEGEKVLIFSQWTSLLDLLEIPIDSEGYKYKRYDGSMTARMRGDAVDDFRDPHKNVRIMLVSLKAGNAGLNLNMASRVIILDPFWNPYIEEQAIDRAHRIGQTRPVKVHRILVENTVEDRIIELQEKKRALISEALDEKQASAIARLGVQELAYLFGITNNMSQRVDYTPRERR